MTFLPALAVSSAAVTAIAVVGSLVTTPDDPWYKALKKPSF
ncbi:MULTISPECIES: tryptophan-rich sensory protein [Rothia]|nr:MULTISPECIES: tryptophan-rich sensory protein [Rothia]